MKEDKQICCEWWAEALDMDSSEYGYGPAIRLNENDSFTVGSVKRIAEYCPWCGSKKKNA